MGDLNLINKKILVTGGNGYLGNKLIEKLISEKANVFSFDLQENSLNSKVTYFKIDLRDKEKLTKIIQEIKPTIIYHLAASLDRKRNFENTEQIYDINLFCTINLLYTLKDIKYEKFIFTSTSEVYGGSKIKSPFKEDCDFVPASPYSLSKYAAEMAIKSFSDLHQKKFLILRLFNFYGEDMPKSFFIPQLIDKLKKNESFDMTKGEQIRDFLHVNDVVKYMIRILGSRKVDKQILNICSGKGKAIKKLALELKNQYNSKSKINFGALPYRDNEVWEMIGDNSRLKKVLETDN